MGEPTRPLPHPDRDSRPWWDLLARHELLLQQCATCGAWRWAPLSGRGTVASWIVNHHAFSTDFPSPYAVVLVRLAEQDDCKLIGSFAGAIESLRPGLEVRAAFDDVDAGVTLLRWEPATPE